MVQSGFRPAIEPTGKMRDVLLLSMSIFMLALGRPAWAGAGDLPEKCDARAQLAERIMWHRQRMNDLEATWRIASIVRDQELSRFGQRLVYEAYQRPRRATEHEQNESIREFTESTRRDCLAEEDSPAEKPRKP
jgi:hypothetical protein